MIKVKLDSLKPADLDDIYRLLQEPDLKQAGIDGKFTREQARYFLDELIGNSFNKMIHLENGEAAGLILVNTRGFDESLIHTREIGFVIFRKYRSQGIATEAVKQLIEFAKANELTELWASAVVDNLASQKVLTNNGFEYKYEADFSIFGMDNQKYYLKSPNH